MQILSEDAQRLNQHSAPISAHFCLGVFFFCCSRLNWKHVRFSGGHAGAFFWSAQRWRVTCVFAQDPFVTSHWSASWISIRSHTGQATPSLGSSGYSARVVTPKKLKIFHVKKRRQSDEMRLNNWLFLSTSIDTSGKRIFLSPSPPVYQDSCVINNRRGVVVVWFLRARATGYRHSLRQP